MTTFKAYLINPEIGSVSEFDYCPESQGWDYLREIMECELIDVVRLPNGDNIYVDDEGLYNNDGELIHTYTYTLHNGTESDYLMGKSVYIGTTPHDEDGLVDSAPLLSLHDVSMNLTYYTFRRK